MAYSVDYSFGLFYDAINLSGDHRETANSRRDDVVGKLKKDFSVVDSFGTGSIPKYTALKGHADLDVMVVLHFSKHIAGKTPTQVLADIRDSLAEYRTGVRRNGQAVTLHYKTWPNVDIVPVSKVVDDGGEILYYNVPDSNTDLWIPSRPKIHAANLLQKAGVCGENFKKIIKMIKHWNMGHSQYLSSYHIEVIAYNIFSSDLSDLKWNVFSFFQEGKSLLERTLWYDKGFADGYLSATDRAEALKRFDTAISLSRSAWYATYGTNDDDKEAITKWRQLFGDKFPAYG